MTAPKRTTLSDEPEVPHIKAFTREDTAIVVRCSCGWLAGYFGSEKGASDAFRLHTKRQLNTP
jgi:hypothetical protein